MPGFKKLRNVLEHLKNISTKVSISAESNDLLSLKIDTVNANISVHFSDLQVSYFDSDNFVSVSANVEIKKIYQFLVWEIVRPTRVLCNIINNKVINLDISLDDYMQINYYIPAQNNE